MANHGNAIRDRFFYQAFTKKQDISLCVKKDAPCHGQTDRSAASKQPLPAPKARIELTPLAELPTHLPRRLHSQSHYNQSRSVLVQTMDMPGLGPPMHILAVGFTRKEARLCKKRAVVDSTLSMEELVPQTSHKVCSLAGYCIYRAVVGTGLVHSCAQHKNPQTTTVRGEIVTTRVISLAARSPSSPPLLPVIDQLTEQTDRPTRGAPGRALVVVSTDASSPGLHPRQEAVHPGADLFFEVTVDGVPQTSGHLIPFLSFQTESHRRVVVKLASAGQIVEARGRRSRVESVSSSWRRLGCIIFAAPPLIFWSPHPTYTWSDRQIYQRVCRQLKQH